MALLTTSDHNGLWRVLYAPGTGKEDLKAWPSLPNRNQVDTMFQALEDRTVADFPSVKATIDTALGTTTTQALAKKIYASYLTWKIQQLYT